MTTFSTKNVKLLMCFGCSYTGTENVLELLETGLKVQVFEEHCCHLCEKGDTMHKHIWFSVYWPTECCVCATQHTVME